jgi:bacillithiol biosynthesis deacetylase BshB1
MRIVVFGIHPDDVELSCGGTMAVQVASGHEVTIVDLSRGESSSNGTPEERAGEAARAAVVLGCRERLNLGLPDAGIQSEDGNQQRRVVEVIRRIRPEFALIPFSDDPHPDHRSGGMLLERALYLAGIHGYDPGAGAWKTPMALVYSGRRQVRPDVVVDVTAVYATKRDAIAAHTTQFGAGAERRPTPLNAPGFLAVIEARDRTVGHSIGVEYGEAFQCLHPIAATDLGGLAGRKV